jgi:hypothetical protein
MKGGPYRPIFVLISISLTLRMIQPVRAPAEARLEGKQPSNVHRRLSTGREAEAASLPNTARVEPARA